jgi:uncharacterized protein (DUF1499 family)
VQYLKRPKALPDILENISPKAKILLSLLSAVKFIRPTVLICVTMCTIYCGHIDQNDTITNDKQMLLKTLCSIGLIIMISTTSNLADSKKLPLCPNSPNCVSSQAIDENHFIAPFKIVADTEQVWIALKQALQNQTRTVITQESDAALNAEATSLIFRFVDDINIILDEEQKLIHIRSASRIGYGDFGVNRRRVEQLRAQLKKGGFIE